MITGNSNLEIESLKKVLKVRDFTLVWALFLGIIDFMIVIFLKNMYLKSKKNVGYMQNCFILRMCSWKISWGKMNFSRMGLKHGLHVSSIVIENSNFVMGFQFCKFLFLKTSKKSLSSKNLKYECFYLQCIYIDGKFPNSECMSIYRSLRFVYLKS